MTPKDQTRAILDGSREDMNRAEIKRLKNAAADEWIDLDRRPGGSGAGAIGWLAFALLVGAYVIISCAILIWAVL